MSESTSVMTHEERTTPAAPDRRQFIIRPNRSLSAGGNIAFFITMVVVSFGIAIPIAMMGYWVVLPFAGFEMLALGIALYVCAHHASSCEVIYIEGDQVTVVSGKKMPQQRVHLNRHWTRVILSPPRARGYPTRLVLRSHGSEVEIGSFLNNKERKQLALALTQAVGT